MSGFSLQSDIGFFYDEPCKYIVYKRAGLKYRSQVTVTGHPKASPNLTLKLILTITLTSGLALPLGFGLGLALGLV